MTGYHILWENMVHTPGLRHCQYCGHLEKINEFYIPHMTGVCLELDREDARVICCGDIGEDKSQQNVTMVSGC